MTCTASHPRDPNWAKCLKSVQNLSRCGQFLFIHWDPAWPLQQLLPRVLHWCPWCTVSSRNWSVGLGVLNPVFWPNEHMKVFFWPGVFRWERVRRSLIVLWVQLIKFDFPLILLSLETCGKKNFAVENRKQWLHSSLATTLFQCHNFTQRPINH